MDRAIFRPFSSSSAGRSDRAAGDRLRHREKVRKSIQENIADIIAEESIIGKDRDRIIKVPIRGIKEYRFIYGDNAPGVGQGDGNSQPGQVVGKRDGTGEGQPDRAGDQPGVDYYETDVTLDELIAMMFEDIELPDLERTRLKQLVTETEHHREGYRNVGVRVHLDVRRTIKGKIKREKQSGISVYQKIFPTEEAVHQAVPEKFWKSYEKRDDGMWHRHTPLRDLKYRHYEMERKEQSNAVVICIMDTSGSMDTMKKYLARCFFFLLYQLIRFKYQQAEVVFIAHHTEAKEVTEEEFFHKGESGGTFISSAYKKALEIIEERYHPSMWNVYTFHCSDGDNFNSDNDDAVKAVRELCVVCNLFGYGEIKPAGVRNYESSMLHIFRKIEADNFSTVLIEKKEDVWPSLKGLLAKDKAVVS